MPKRDFIGEEYLSNELTNKIKNEVGAYRDFALRGDMLKMAIAFIIGASFNSVVKGLSNHLIMPIVGFFTNAVAGGDWRLLTWEPVKGLILETGPLAGCFIDFFVISLVLFILYIKIIKPYLEATKEAEVIEEKKDDIALVNWTPKDELIAIKGIGVKTAEKIIDGYPYDDLDQLKNKADLSSSVMAKLKTWINER